MTSPDFDARLGRLEALAQLAEAEAALRSGRMPEGADELSPPVSSAPASSVPAFDADTTAARIRGRRVPADESAVHERAARYARRGC